MAQWVNRSALVVRFRQPYIDWATGIDAEGPKHAEMLKTHFSVYLVAEDPRGREESKPVKVYYHIIFEHELEAWCTDEDLWPEPRTYAMFKQWFQVSAESIVTDLEDEEPLVHEE